MSGQPETWSVHMAPAAARALDRLPHRASGAIVGFITATLPGDPRPLSRPLRHELSGWRVARRGDYRVTFRILEDNRLLLIGRIEHRSQWVLELAPALPVPADR